MSFSRSLQGFDINSFSFLLFFFCVFFCFCSSYRLSFDHRLPDYGSAWRFGFMKKDFPRSSLHLLWKLWHKHEAKMLFFLNSSLVPVFLQPSFPPKDCTFLKFAYFSHILTKYNRYCKYANGKRHQPYICLPPFPGKPMLHVQHLHFGSGTERSREHRWT